MKLFAGWLAAAILVFTFTGCGDETDTPEGQKAVPTADGRPAGFEDMMKGMEKDMKKSMTNPKNPARPGVPAKLK